MKYGDSLSLTSGNKVAFILQSDSSSDSLRRDLRIPKAREYMSRLLMDGLTIHFQLSNLEAIKYSWRVLRQRVYILLEA